MSHYQYRDEILPVFANPNLKTTFLSSYWKGRGGVRWIARLGDRLFYVSESDVDAPSTPYHMLQILSNGAIDFGKTVKYVAHRRNGFGLRIEIWYGGRWIQIFSPCN